ncbi:leucine-rich repeat domain-containing protein [Streptomyces roseolilacinus]|uniref:leucine-rich repeat domain-containing protein n=1 Tax=Streptomyces roseolilacinus TaxID=66904 RepID=UPI0038097CAD
MTDEGEPGLPVNRWGDTSDPAPGRRGPRQDGCSCFDQSRPRPRARVRFHGERQDTSAPGWRRLLELVDEAAADGREEFRPLVGLSPEQRRQIVTLPAGIARLTAVRHLVLHGSNLVRVPPEIGAMTSLEEFTPYTSYRLHWFPYEITRCRRLTRSTVSTRALFGNRKLRPPFPRLRPSPGSVTGPDPGGLDPRRWGATAVRGRSVCDRPVGRGGLHQAWLSLRVATDVLPPLVNACSAACVAALPEGALHHLPAPHAGGRVEQPAPARG